MIAQKDQIKALKALDVPSVSVYNSPVSTGY